MSNTGKRREAIIHRLASHILEDLRCAVVTPSKQSWSFYQLSAPYRFGWMPPVQVVDDTPALLVSFCPELIAETTAWLDDEQLDVYLTVVEAFIDAMVAQFSEPVAEVYHRVQNSLYETAPDALALVSQVEVRALDDGIVPVAPART